MLVTCCFDLGHHLHALMRQLVASLWSCANCSSIYHSWGKLSDCPAAPSSKSRKLQPRRQAHCPSPKPFLHTVPAQSLFHCGPAFFTPVLALLIIVHPHLLGTLWRPEQGRLKGGHRIIFSSRYLGNTDATGSDQY